MPRPGSKQHTAGFPSVPAGNKSFQRGFVPKGFRKRSRNPRTYFSPEYGEGAFSSGSSSAAANSPRMLFSRSRAASSCSIRFQTRLLNPSTHSLDTMGGGSSPASAAYFRTAAHCFITLAPLPGSNHPSWPCLPIPRPETSWPASSCLLPGTQVFRHSAGLPAEVAVIPVAPGHVLAVQVHGESSASDRFIPRFAKFSRYGRV